MSNQRGHDLTTCFLAPIVAGAAIYFLGWLNGLVIGISFCFAGFMFNGDLDCHSSPYKRWLVLRFIWIPYRWLGSHRSIFSHAPVIGTVGRLAWLLLIFGTPMLIFVPLPLVIGFCTTNWVILSYAILGLELGAMSHTINDAITSF